MGVSKSKFLSAASQLEEANLGTVVVLERVSRSSHVFVKKSLDEAAAILTLPENVGYCTVEEYAMRFQMSMPTTITSKMRICLIDRGLLSPEFRNKPPELTLASQFLTQ